nr:MAG TPA: hypothetical protein [Caudoviricetes sp.]
MYEVTGVGDLIISTIVPYQYGVVRSKVNFVSNAAVSHRTNL